MAKVCYSTVWLLIETIDHEEENEILGGEVLVPIGVEIGRCLRQLAVTVARNVVFLLNQLEISRFIVVIVLKRCLILQGHQDLILILIQ